METIKLAPPYNLYLPLIKTGPPPCSVPPTLLSPANGSSLDTLIPMFEWNSGTDPAATQFMMYVARDPGFTQVVSSLGFGSGQGLGNYRFWSNFDPATTYYWRAWLILRGKRFKARTRKSGRSPPAPEGRSCLRPTWLHPQMEPSLRGSKRSFNGQPYPVRWNIKCTGDNPAEQAATLSSQPACKKAVSVKRRHGLRVVERSPQRLRLGD